MYIGSTPFKFFECNFSSIYKKLNHVRWFNFFSEKVLKGVQKHFLSPESFGSSFMILKEPFVSCLCVVSSIFNYGTEKFCEG